MFALRSRTRRLTDRRSSWVDVGAVPEAGGPTEPLLTVDGVSVDFGTFRALDAVDLTVAAGEVVGLAGENGAGKSTLVRCIAGDVAPDAGQVVLAGRRLRPSAVTTGRAGVAVVWQDLSLCDNLDIAANLLLGGEHRFGLLSDSRFHAEADGLLGWLGIPLTDSSRPVSELSGGQRQLVAVARAMRDRPRLLVLDEPTASLGVAETAQVEELTLRLRALGTTILLVSHDIGQMARLADRVVVLRRGRVAGEVDPSTAHPDDLVAVINGQALEGSARRQLSRLHGLAGRLAEADPSSSLELILSALSAALGTGQACIHLLEDGGLRGSAALGLTPAVVAQLSSLPLGPPGGPVGEAASGGRVVVAADLRLGGSAVAGLLAAAGVRACWAVPVPGPAGVSGVLTVFAAAPAAPDRDELDLMALYAGYVSSAVERERLLADRTARNRVLETIREVLENLAGPASLREGLSAALVVLRTGLGAEEVGLFSAPYPDGTVACRSAVGPRGACEPGGPLTQVAEDVLVGPGVPGPGHPHALSVRFAVPGGDAALVALAVADDGSVDRPALLDDAARSLRLALEREGSERARQEAAALRRSKELHQRFLLRLSHELRTPLTAIHGYTSSLIAADVAWDRATEDRFLARISAESLRLARLVDDLLDSSAIESGTLRLQPDWCDVPLVLDSARACLPPGGADAITFIALDDLAAVWADHDRLEQVFVNLMDNAIRHNPAGTAVTVRARQLDGEVIEVTVADDGGGEAGLHPGIDGGEGTGRRGPSSGAGLGLSIARGIVDAHGGRLSLRQGARGTTATVVLPIEQPARPAGPPGPG